MGSTNERERIHEFVSSEARVAPTAIIEDARYRSTPGRSRGQSVIVSHSHRRSAAQRNASFPRISNVCRDPPDPAEARVEGQ
jgi:hypothetical protein